jgi:hypothetical protein
VESRKRERPLGLGLPITKFPQKKTNPEIEHKLREINKKNGLIDISGNLYQTSVNDLEDLGELGNGTSGHVVKMRHKPSGAIIAVKVRTFHLVRLCIQSTHINNIPANAKNWQ